MRALCVRRLHLQVRERERECSPLSARVSLRFTQRSHRFFGLFHCSIVYVESFARVKSLSMSGHIMYHLADKFVVQWEGLCARYPRAVYAGVLC
jgi:hypothetical protein